MKSVYKRYHLIMEVLCLLLCVVPLSLLFWRWNQLPAELPMHYDASGTVTRYGSKFEVLPLVFLYIGMYLLLTLVALCPNSWNLPVKVTDKNREPVWNLALTMIILLKLLITGAYGYMILAMTGFFVMNRAFFPVLIATGVLVVVVPCLMMRRYK